MARSTLRYALTTALLTTFTLSGCGGGSSNATGPTDTTVAAAPAPTPKPRPAPRQFQMTVIARGLRSPSGSDGGCVILRADSPQGSDTGCSGESTADITGDEGTRGTVTAVPASGYQFLGWTDSSSDCGGETKNPCSFAFDRDKVMTARFGR